MLLDQVTETQMRTIQILSGASMAAFLLAPIFRKRAQSFRLALTVFYIAAILGLFFYFI